MNRTISPACASVAALAAVLAAACAGAASSSGPRTPEPSPATPAPSVRASPTLAPSPTPAVAVPAGRIAVVLGRDDGADEVIVTLRPDGTDEWRVPVDITAPNEGPEWVPGTETLLFDSGRSRSIDLYRVDVPGGTVQPITTTKDRFEGFPAVSPDGSTVVFDNADQDGSLGLWAMDLDGSHARRLVPRPEPPTFDSAPAFSPDGRFVAFIRKRSQQPPNPKEAVFVANADGSAVRQLTDWDLDVGRVRWAPDGSHLVFSDHAEHGTTDVPTDLWRVEPDGSNLARITHNVAGQVAYHPDYSPDGSRIVYVGWHTGLRHNELWTADPDGGNAVRIFESPDGTFLEWPAWGDAG